MCPSLIHLPFYSIALDTWQRSFELSEILFTTSQNFQLRLSFWRLKIFFSLLRLTLAYWLLNLSAALACLFALCCCCQLAILPLRLATQTTDFDMMNQHSTFAWEEFGFQLKMS